MPWGRLNIQKRELGVKGISKDQQAFFKVHQGTPVPSTPYSLSVIMTEGKHARGSQGHDKGERHMWGFERGHPGCTQQAGHGP
jgi:hypothetical protein